VFFFNFIISVRGGHYYYLRRELQIARGLIGAGGTVHCPLSFAHYNKRSASWLFLSLQVERRRVVGGWVGGGGGIRWKAAVFTLYQHFQTFRPWRKA